VGYPGRSGEDALAVREVADALSSATVETVALAFVREWEAELDACIASGAEVINVVYRASDRLHRVLGVTRGDALERTQAAVARVVDAGRAAAFTPSDATRADLAFLSEMWAAAAEAGASRIYVADSMGAATPELIALLVRRACERVGLPVGVHCHNDFGVAVANTIAGVGAGAEYVDVAVNGLGDRAGNAPLEEVVAALSLLHGIDSGIDLSTLTTLSRRFAEVSGRALPPNKPISGSAVFTHVLPTHVSAMERDPLAIQPVEPAVVGNTQRLKPGG
jgi:isopropylmalate/homocitrate/citramalate synthase